MDNQRLNVIGNHNITGNHLNNVGNRTLNIVVSRPEGASGSYLLRLHLLFFLIICRHVIDA